MKCAAELMFGLLLFIHASACVARADLVILDAADFPLGTEVNDALPGATLTAIGTSVPTPRVFIDRRSFTNVFAHDGEQAAAWREVSFSDFEARLRVDFEVPTNLVTIGFMPTGTDGAGLIDVFNGHDTLLDSLEFREFDTVGEVYHVVVERQAADIQYLVASTPDGAHITIANVGYRQIPEPTTATLILACVLCIRCLPNDRSARRSVNG